LLIWIIEAVLDCYLFHKGAFWELFIFNVPKHDIYFRSLPLACFTVFGFIIANIMKKQKKSEAVLRESEENYRLLIVNQTDLVVKVDMDGKFQFVNPSYCKLFGKTREELLGKKVAPRIHEMDDQPLIDKYLPEYTFNEIHEIVINSPIERVYSVAKNFDLSKSKLIVFLFKIRGLPTKRLNLQELISDFGFSNIEEQFPTENLIGFWARTKIEPIINHKDFINNTISARIKIVWNFRFSSLTSTRTKVSTETRILCVHPVTKVLFSLYWLIVRPFSGIIRIKMLKIIKQDAETIQKNG